MIHPTSIPRLAKQLLLLALTLAVSEVMVFAVSYRVTTASGVVEGMAAADPGIRAFEGIPFAAPPVGNLRWQPPQPVAPWTGIREAKAFGPRCMQTHMFADMVFRDAGPSEDCLYLNVWTPARSAHAHLPVMVWIYGGGFQAGGTSEPRQDGQYLAEKGVVVVSGNYRLGIFGFLSLPELTAESPHHASGNYGLMDQIAVLGWVKQNIAAFGGDPNNVTIFGESAGAFSVSALMAAPPAQGLFQKAIGESGSFMGAGPQLHGAQTLPESEKAGEKFAKQIGAPTLKDLRAIPADRLLEDTKKEFFWPNIDGYVLPENAYNLFKDGKQSHVPLLAGWNLNEQSHVRYDGQTPTPESFEAHVRKMFGAQADEALKFYPHATQAEAVQSADRLASDFFTVYDTWKWLQMQRQTGDAPVYRYLYTRTPPEPPADAKVVELGARHSADIEYVFETIDWKKSPNEPVDYKLSDSMATYWSNFAKTGNPNGKNMPGWPIYNQQDGYAVMILGEDIHARPSDDEKRFEFLDSFVQQYRTK
jgi:para-nitrobenzyl esterase